VTLCSERSWSQCSLLTASSPVKQIAINPRNMRRAAGRHRQADENSELAGS
jgi:hypothetical protein